MVKTLAIFAALTSLGQDPAPKCTAKQLRDVPVDIALDARPFKLDAFLWRDFMPIAPPGGKPLMAVLSLRALDKKPVPAELRMDMAWIVSGEEIWAARITELRNCQTDASILEAVVRNGPKWPPGATVDVVVQLRDAQAKTYLLRAAGQKIQRTD